MPRGHFKVLRGNPTPEELAAVVTVLVLVAAASAEALPAPLPPRVARPHWQARRRITHARGRHLPAAAWTGVGGGGPWPGVAR